MKLKFSFSFVILAAIAACNSPSNRDDSAGSTNYFSDPNVREDEAPGVYFVNLKDGDTVRSPVIVEMGVRGKEVEPSGTVHPEKGHHHIIVDGSFIKADETVPTDSIHLHFGKGETSDTLYLHPGKHTLTLQFANGNHISFGKGWSKTITITVTQ